MLYFTFYVVGEQNSKFYVYSIYTKFTHKHTPIGTVVLPWQLDDIFSMTQLSVLMTGVKADNGNPYMWNTNLTAPVYLAPLGATTNVTVVVTSKVLYEYCSYNNKLQVEEKNINGTITKSNSTS